MSQAQPEAQPENSQARSRPMLLVAERQIPDPAPTISPQATTSPTSNQAAVEQANWKAGARGAINVLAAVLAVRLILLVATVGAIALAWLAAQEHDPYRLGALGAYTVTVVVPLIWLSARR